MTATISPRELAAKKTAGEKFDLIDVRTPEEFGALHVEFAKNIPLDRFDTAKAASGGADGAKPLYIICRSGARAGQACKLLAAAGVKAVNVEGGSLAWEKAGLPVVRHAARGISMERQVRIAAGCLVVAGVALGWAAHPAWLGLAAFVGAGLIFAGITDSCGLALFLSRMPWNTKR